VCEESPPGARTFSAMILQRFPAVVKLLLVAFYAGQPLIV
jgi:hypothetical protein